MSFRKRSLATLLAGFVFLSIAVAKDAPAPYRVVVFAGYGEPLGPESLRDEIERELTERLEVDRCFESVVRSGAEPTADADLIIEVILDGYIEETLHDVTITTQKRSAEPGSDLHWSARLETVVHLQVRRAADRAVVKMKRKHASVTRRAQPLEDTRYEARAALLERIVHGVHAYLCDVAPRKWEKQIRQARSPDGSD